MDNLFVIIGLGNPGLKYRNTRHNMGFRTIDELSKRLGIKISKIKFKSVYGEGKIADNRVLLVKPQTFMNLSGECVREIFEWYKVPFSNLILIYDDVDLSIGTVRFRPKGSAGTHNGMRSVIYQLQTDEFPRVRIGVGRPDEGWDLADFVLGKFNKEEIEVIDKAICEAADLVVDTVKNAI